MSHRLNLWPYLPVDELARHWSCYIISMWVSGAQLYNQDFPLLVVCHGTFQPCLRGEAGGCHQEALGLRRSSSWNES